MAGKALLEGYEPFALEDLEKEEEFVFILGIAGKTPSALQKVRSFWNEEVAPQCRKAVQSFLCSSVANFSREYVKQRLEKNQSVRTVYSLEKGQSPWFRF